MDREEAIKLLYVEKSTIIEVDGNKGAEKMLQAYDMAIEALSADPTELLQDGTLKVNVKNGADVSRVLVWGDDGSGGLYYADDMESGELSVEEVAELLADLFGDECACNYNDIDEWLPYVCDHAETECPAEGNRCWMQFIKHRGAKMKGGE